MGTDDAGQPNPGGVCVEIPESITNAAAGSCAYGFVNINATRAPSATPAPTPEVDEPDEPVAMPTPKPDKPAPKPTPRPDKPAPEPTTKPGIEMSMRRLDDWLQNAMKDFHNVDHIGFVGSGGRGGVGGLDRMAKKRKHRVLRNANAIISDTK